MNHPLVSPTFEIMPTLMKYPPPLYLKHKPIYMLPYQPFDGCYAGDNDAQYLSIGLAQWRLDLNDPDAISAKVWRYDNNNNKWHRNSEELPLHRVIDLCIFLTATLFGKDKTSVTFQAGRFKNQKEAIELNMLENIPESFESEKDAIRERLNELCRVLKETGIWID